jgi:arginine/lysine/ornithine decarboxylase
MDSNRLIDALRKIKDENLVSFHMPGHKNNEDFFREKLGGLDLIDVDLTEIPGTDNLHRPTGCLMNSQKRLSEFYKSHKSYFLVNGSTCGILAMIFATTKRNDKILVNRNAHQSVMNGIALNGLRPVYIMPEIHASSGMILGVTAEGLEEKLSNDSEIKTVLLTYPSYEGICFDLDKISKIIKKYNCQLIIDEAHGSHLLSHEELPISACESAADIVVQSAHKNLPAFTQGAFIHLYNKGLQASLEKYLKIFQSSSPSYLIMASLDFSVDYLFKESQLKTKVLLDEVKDLVKELKKTNYKVLNWGIDYNRLPFTFDPTKLIISGLKIGLNGQTLEKILREAYGIQIEYSTDNFIVLIASAFNKSEDFKKLYDSLKAIEEKYRKSEIKSKKPLILEDVVVRIKPNLIDQYNYKIETIDQCLGKIAYESIVPYPPGIPLINPGEEVTKEAIHKLKKMVSELKIVEE